MHAFAFSQAQTNSCPLAPCSTDPPDFFKAPYPQGGYGGGGGAAVAADGSISTDEINRKLTEREQFRMNRDFDNADRVREELRAAGVQVDDRERMWRHTDGRSGGRPDARPR